jgi:acyl-CoA synthetase (AMP-forming)/AMP-acid ligase II
MAHDWDLRTPAAHLVREYFAAGWWDEQTCPVVTAEGLRAYGALRFQIVSTLRPYDGTLGDVADLGARLAGCLTARGYGAGDVIAFQVPNWVEAAACLYGLLFLGAVVVPVVHIYGAKEVGHILRQSRARVLITADAFGHQDYLANLDALIGGLPDLELVVVVTDDTVPALDRECVSWARTVPDADRLDALPEVDPDEPVVIGYTSGTTAAPKGVVHTHRTLLAEMRGYPALEETDLTPPSPYEGSLSGAPLSHITGLLSVLMPIIRGRPVHLIDRWDPKVVLETMVSEQVSAPGGATFFLTSLLDDPHFDPDVHLPLMRKTGLGGAPIPPEVARRAAAMGISLVRAYGSTEHPSTTMAVHSDPEPKRLYTDGHPMPGVELRLRDDDGNEVAVGDPGEIVSRGPDLFVGYTDPLLTATAIDADGWYATGDVGILDDDGYLTITDRKKDIIIRGGENISAAEVEELLQRMPGVSECAVVAAPDERYGEHGCAFVHMADGSPVFALPAMRAHLDASGLARQKWPEELRFVDEFPRTASGKIQKHVLRARLRAEP